MKPDKQQLIHDLLGEPACREATLAAGAQILRRRRQRRATVRGLAVVLMFAVAGIWLERANRHTGSVQIMVQKPLTASPSPILPVALTDDELLALFPDTPVGLVTLSDGRKRLIFPHPGDEQKFITRL